MGHLLTQQLLAAGHDLTLLNRGLENESIPEGVHHLRADRTDRQQMKRALMAKDFDAVVDFVLYNAEEAHTVTNLLHEHAGHYIFISTGQVYLVRQGIERPFSEDQFDQGMPLPAPKPHTFAYEEWTYGTNKRAAEEVLFQAHAENGFPFTTLRLPMVNSERDPFKRLYNYILRLKDGGPLLIPERPNFALRHVYGEDVIQAISRLIDSGPGTGKAYNISQDESVSIDEFLALLGEIMGVTPLIVRLSREALLKAGFLPDCSPFTERWMSELTNERSKTELGMQYTPLRDYLTTLVDYYATHTPQPPVSYKRRAAEIELATQHGGNASTLAS